MARRRPRVPAFLNTQRDDYSIARDLADDTLELARGSLLDTIDRSTSVRSTLSEVEDRRTYHPAGISRPARSSRRFTVPIAIQVGDGTSPRSQNSPLRRGVFSSSPIQAFKYPRSVAICVRRKSRREVIHAMGFAGGKTTKLRRRNSNSDIRC